MNNSAIYFRAIKIWYRTHFKTFLPLKAALSCTSQIFGSAKKPGGIEVVSGGGRKTNTWWDDVTHMGKGSPPPTKGWFTTGVLLSVILFLLDVYWQASDTHCKRVFAKSLSCILTLHVGMRAEEVSLWSRLSRFISVQCKQQTKMHDKGSFFQAWRTLWHFPLLPSRSAFGSSGSPWNKRGC